MFNPNRAFKKDYDKLFKKDPLQANMLLLLYDLADKKGQITFEGDSIEQIQELMFARFNDPLEYQL